MTLGDAMRMALDHHKAGRLGEAEKLYRFILSKKPQDAQSLQLLGTIAGQVGKPQEGVKLMRHAIAIDSSQRHYHFNLGVALGDLGQRDEAIEAYRAAIRVDPDYA